MLNTWITGHPWVGHVFNVFLSVVVIALLVIVIWATMDEIKNNMHRKALRLIKKWVGKRKFIYYEPRKACFLEYPSLIICSTGGIYLLAVLPKNDKDCRNAWRDMLNVQKKDWRARLKKNKNDES